jgi:hypothetical protein
MPQTTVVLNDPAAWSTVMMRRGLVARSYSGRGSSEEGGSKTS